MQLKSRFAFSLRGPYRVAPPISDRRTHAVKPVDTSKLRLRSSIVQWLAWHASAAGLLASILTQMFMHSSHHDKHTVSENLLRQRPRSALGVRETAGKA